MDFQAYIPNAMRTARLFDDPKLDMRHALLGLITELGEFTTNVKRMAIYDKPLNEEMRQHMIEEGGDVFWYIPLAMMADGQSVLPAPNEFQSASIPDNLSDLVVFLSAMIGGLAASLHTGLSSDPEERNLRAECMSGIVHGMDAAAKLLGTDGDQMRAQNILKLQKRFPEKFTVEAAEARADKGGLSALES